LKKIIKRQAGVCVDVRDGLNKVKEEFYSHDKNNAYIELKLNGLNAEKVIVLFKFKTTNRLLEVAGTVEDNLVSIPFDTSLITTDEIVDGFVYAEKVVQSADILKFSFGVRVSEIDKHSELPVIEKETKRIVAVTDIVTKAELEEAIKNIHIEGATYDDSNIRSEISHISADIEALKAKTDKDTVYDDSALKQRLTALESKPEKDTSNLVTRQELESKNYLTSHQDISRLATKEELNNLVTKQELRDKNYLTSHQSLSDYALKSELPTPYNDLELKKRVERLEEKPDLDTSNFVTNEVLNSKGYLTQHQSLEGYAKKSEIPQAYNDTEVKQRLSVVEQKGESYATKEQLASIPKTPQKLILTGTTLTLSDGGGSVTLPSSTSGNTGQANEYEIHGQGFPNGKVSAPVGTTYVDTNVTNGALKWIKRQGTDKQGWEVLTGDTGWRKLRAYSVLGNSAIHVRRINNQITYKFDGLQWGWFGILRRNGAGYVPHPSNREKKMFIINNGDIPYGFRAPFSLIGQIFNDNGVPYGTWYIGSATDANHLRFQFLEPVPTDRDIGDIRVSLISYVTDDPWPTTLP